MQLGATPSPQFKAVVNKAAEQVSYGLQMMEGDPDIMGIDKDGATRGARHADALVDAATAFPAPDGAVQLAKSAQPVLRQAIESLNAMDDDGYPTQRTEAIAQLKQAMDLLGQAGSATA